MAGMTGLQLKVATADRYSTKKQQSGQLMGVRIEGHVMVHRTDIAGGSTGQTSPGSDRTCRRALNGVLLENKLSHSSDNKKVLPSPDGGSPTGSCHLFRTSDP